MVKSAKESDSSERFSKNSMAGWLFGKVGLQRSRTETLDGELEGKEEVKERKSRQPPEHHTFGGGAASWDESGRTTPGVPTDERRGMGGGDEDVCRPGRGMRNVDSGCAAGEDPTIKKQAGVLVVVGQRTSGWKGERDQEEGERRARECPWPNRCGG